MAMLLVSGADAAAYSYKITVAASMPKGFAGEKLATTQPTNTKTTPCSTAKIDAVTFTVTYDAGKVVADLKDVYLILYNPGLGASPLYTIKRNALGTGPTLTAYATAALATAAAATDIYVKTTENPGTGSISETVLGGSIIVEGVASGTWQLVGIIADKATVDFDKPSTWAAWDVGTIVFGLPWTGTAAASTDTCASIVP